MAARGTLFGEGPTACPFVALELDRDRRSDRPDYRHRCYAEPTPAPRTIAHQEAYCLSPNFPTCPIFQDWAVRAAARPVPLPQGYEGRRSEPAEVAPVAALAASAEPEPAMSAGSSEPEWPDSMASSVSIGAATDASLADAGDGPDGQLGAFDSPAAAPEPAPAPAAAPAAVASPAPEPAASPNAADLDDAYDNWPDEPPPTETPEEPAGDLEAAPAPAFLAARSARPRPSPKLDDGVKREDVVPSWEIDGRYGAQSGGPPNTGGAGFGRLLTIVAVILILALGVLAVFTLPGLLAGNPSRTARPQTSGLATNLPTPLSSNVVVPTSTALLPSITPTVTPTESTPTPEPTPVTYRIKPGDTLARVARKFDTTVEAIMAANPQIDNPNHIEVGQVILIPLPPPPATP